MERKSKRNLFAVVGLAVVVLIAGTIAYWSQTSTIDNPFDTGKFGATVIEHFKPDDGESWQPGVKVNKEVLVDNTGDQDMIVRVRLDETWTYKGQTTPYKDSSSFPSGQTVYGPPYQPSATDGLTAADGTVVLKTFATPSTNWIAGAGGWYYYRTNLKGGTQTDKWLESITLISDVDVGNLETRYYVSPSTSTNLWYEYTGKMPAYINASGVEVAKDAPGAQQVLRNKSEVSYAVVSGQQLKGYSDSDYVLKVTVQTVQATQDAVNAMFGGGSAFTAPAGVTWTLK